MRFCFCVTVVLYFIAKSNCKENNVCPTFKDYYTLKNNSNCWYDFSADHNVGEIIEKHGFPVETYKVVTVDGYILTVFRIPNHYVETQNRKGPVFIQHGFQNSAAVFVTHGRDSLAFVLADAGYDVWLGNYRGNQYSEEHVNLTVFDKQYWDYSIDELGLYDIPAQLELIVRKTGQKGNIVYIGHSLGTTGALVYSSSYPKAARETVKLFILLAPAANVANTKAPVATILKPVFGIIKVEYIRIIRIYFKEGFTHPEFKEFVSHTELYIGLYSDLKMLQLCIAAHGHPKDHFVTFVIHIIVENDLIRLTSQAGPLQKLVQLICLESPLLMKRCYDFINYLGVGPQTQTEANSMPVILKHVPSGISIKVLKQLADFSLLNYFGRYDEGLNKNFKKYGSVFPPKYDVRKIEVPVFIMYAINDWATVKEDAIILYNKLSSTARYGIHEISEPNFNHADFLVGRNVKELVYDYIIKLLKQIHLEER